MTSCPIECIEKTWLEKHESFVITLVGLVSGVLGLVFTYFLKSRCTKIHCCGVGCTRNPITLDASDVNVEVN